VQAAQYDTFAVAPVLLVRPAELRHHGQRHRGVLVGIYLDVSLEVGAEGGGAGQNVWVALDHPLEHARDEVFAAEGERRRPFVRAALGDEVEGVSRERPGLGRHAGVGQRGPGIRAVLDRSDDREHGRGVGPDLPHALQVELEVAEEAVLDQIAFFDQDNLVDEPARHAVLSRNPRRLHTGEITLQGLQQGHEIPDGERVALHEDTQLGQRLDLAVDRMGQHPHPRGLDRDAESVDGSVVMIPCVAVHLAPFRPAAAVGIPS
jgi:hypothetical protein